MAMQTELFQKLEDEWFKEMCRWGDVGKYVMHVGGENQPDKFQTRRYRFFTETNRYLIVARVEENGHTYLGCQGSTRKPRAGESHTRGNDLPDGPFTKETWDAIVAAVVAYELVELIVPVEPVAETEEE